MSQRENPISRGVLKTALDANGQRVTNMADPVEQHDAVTKGYLENHGGGGGVLDDTVTQTSDNGVKSRGIWSWVKGLLPSWLTPTMAEPVESVNGKTGAVELSAADVLTGKQQSAVDSGITSDLVPKVLTVDESTATKKIVLGEKTFNSFTELTALVQNGVTRLKYYVTNAASRPVLYTAHLCDASAIRFDATGTLGETVYTRSIAITKTGADGIAVTVGTLTAMAKASELAGKLDKSGGTMTGVLIVEDSDAGNGVVLRNWSGDVSLMTGGSPDGPALVIVATRADDGRIVNFYLPEVKDLSRNETLALLSDIADATKLTPVYEWMDNGEGVIPDGVMVRNVGRPYSDDVPDPYNNATWHIDFEISTDGGQYWDSATYDDSYGASVGELNFGGFFCFTRMVDHYTTAKGESILAGTKAALFAGAAFREAAFGKAATSAANLESGNVAVVDGSAGGTVTVSFKANATGDNSLRYCELLVTGVTADDAVTISLPAGTYQFADGADKTSTGNNHFVFAEYAGGWMVNKTVRTEATITEG